jgi:hypothetical protein
MGLTFSIVGMKDERIAKILAIRRQLRTARHSARTEVFVG